MFDLSGPLATHTTCPNKECTSTGGTPVQADIGQFDGSFGGPIKKDRVWFFTSFRKSAVETAIKLGAAMRDVRGDRIGMIFQEPMTSLNPTFTVGFQITEVLRIHRGLRQSAARAAALELLGMVGMGAPERRLAQYPHELSGGLRQRAMIAMAIACRPALLIADEPTTALDVTIQAQILDLIKRLQREMGMSVLLITHDLGIVAEMCERVIVMYAGRIVERASAADAVSPAAPPLYRGPARFVAAPRQQAAGVADHPRHGAEPGPARRGVLLRRKVPARPRPLPNRGAAARGIRTGSRGRLLEPRAMTALLRVEGLAKDFPARGGKGRCARSTA